MDLLELRQQLDQVDRSIVELFEKRMSICSQVAEYKIETGKAVLDREREKQKIAAVRALAQDEFNSQAVEELFTQLLAMSRKLQYRILASHGRQGSDSGFAPVEKLWDGPVRVVFQGVEGAYSHAAMLQYFGREVSSYHVEQFEDAMRDVRDGKADFAVLPIENSSAGIVSGVYDLLVKYDNCIVAETFVKVEHALLGLEDAKLSDIKTVYSHPQALMQSSQYLNARRDWRQISLENTAVAAKKVVEDGDVTQAAVASEIAGELYGLKVLCRSINHNKNNVTRFIILSRDKIYRRDASKVSVCFELAHESGTLYNMLSNFIYNNVNMTMIESRPIVGKNWEYRFFVDFEGNLGDEGVQNALNGIRQEALDMKILGNY